MFTPDRPIAISTADDTITAGVCLWQRAQTRFATVAVKATFTIVPGAAMTLRAPLPIECSERQIIPSQGIEPGDLAPCLVQPEIWVRGHAWHPPAEGAPSVRVRLIVARDGTPLLRKSIEIPIPPEAFAPPFLHAFAPLSRTWPVRTRLLGAFDGSALERSPIDLPDVFDWNYFQAAPADQRLGPLRGDEWIRLEAIHPTIRQFDTRLPAASCTAMMFGKVEPFCHGVPLRVGLDTVQINADNGTCALVFRGHTPLPVDVALDDLQFVTGLSLPDRPLPHLEPRTIPQRKPASMPPAHPAGQTPSVGKTLALRSARKTLELDASTLLAHADALPFQPVSLEKPPQKKLGAFFLAAMNAPN